MYSNNNFGLYGVDDKLDKLQNDNFLKSVEDPFMFKAFLRNIKDAWNRYRDYKDRLSKDVTALMELDSAWKENMIALNTEHTVYGDDAKAVILRMRTGKITAREDWVDFIIEVKNLLSSIGSGLSAKSLEDLIDVKMLFDDVMDELVRDNARLIENMLSEAQRAANEAENCLKKYGGFTFQYNISLLGFSIEISDPPFTPSITLPPYDNSPSSDNSPPSYDSASPSYDPLPYTLYTVKPGDSFWKIAAEQMGSGARYEELARYNGLTPSSVIHPGDVLKIPR